MFHFRRTIGLTFCVSILAVNSFAAAPSLTAENFGDQTIGSLFSRQLQAVGGTTPYTFVVSAGTLPPGIVLAADGTLIGAPTEIGAFDFSVKVSDDNSETGSADFEINVVNSAAHPDGLLHWWPGEGDGIDRTGDGSALLMGGVSFAPGKTGFAYSLDGTDDYLRLPNNVFPYPTTGTASTPFTFCAWFKTDKPGMILGQQNNEPYDPNTVSYIPAIYIGTDGLLRVWLFWGAGQGGQFTHPTPMNDNVFHHIAVTYDGTQSVYLDGQLIGTAAFVQNSYTNNYRYQIGLGFGGGYPATTGGWMNFSGLIDEPMLFGVALTADEVKGIAFGSGQTPDIMPLSLPRGAVGLPYSHTLDLPFASPPYKFEITSGALPDGLALAPKGTISGTPTKPGGFDFTITATDAGGSTGVRRYSIGISYTDNNTSPAPALCSWWKGEGNANDSAGLANGQVINNVAYVPGMVGQCFSFNGLDSYIQLPDGFFPYITTGSPDLGFTFEGWFRTQSGGCIFAQQGNTPFAPNGWVPGVYVGVDGRLYCEVFWNSGVQPLQSPITVNDNQWHHVAVTYDGTTQSAYLDGQRFGRTPHTQTFYAAIVRYQFGVGYSNSWPGGNGGTYFFKGELDEPSLYNHPLAWSEIQAIYNAREAGKSPPAIEANLANWWPADGDAKDRVGTAHGTLVGSKTYAPGLIGQAFSFNGDTDYVQLPGDFFSAFPGVQNNNRFSFELWFKTDRGGIIFGQTGNGHVPGIYVGDDGLVRTEMFWKGGDDTIVSATPVNDDQWHHIAVTYDTTVQIAYLDGVAMGQKNHTQVGYGGPYQYFLGWGKYDGWRNNTLSPYFKGLIDEPAAYNRVLTPEEITDRFQKGSQHIQRVPVPNVPSLVSWWRAEGDAQDSIGNNHGILMNGAGFTQGKIGRAFNFDGADDYIKLPDHFFPFARTGTNTLEFTFETWFKTSTGGCIFSQQGDYEAFVNVNGWVPGLYVGVDGLLYAELFWKAAVDPINTSTQVNDGKFHHAVVTYDGANQVLYVDGEQIGTKSHVQYTYGATTYKYQFGVGYSAGWPGGNGGWYPFQGVVDEPILYNRAFTKEEVEQLFTLSGGGRVGPVADDLQIIMLHDTARLITLPASNAGGEALTLTVSASAHGSLSAVNDNEVTYTPNAGYVGPDSFTYVAKAGSLSAKGTVFIQVNASNVAPIIVTGASAMTYLEGSGGLPVDGGAHVVDLDGTTLTGAVVQLAGHYVRNQDALSYSDDDGITGSYDADTAILTLTGNASAAAYTNALRRVLYSNSSNRPDVTPRAVTFSVTDGDTSPVAIRNIIVVSVNSVPVISTPNPVTIDEHSATDTISFGISDLESPPGSLIVTAAASDETLVPQAGIVLGGTDEDRSIQITPAPFASGAVIITISAKDPDGGIGTTTFELTIVPIADTPTLTVTTPVSGAEGTEIPLTIQGMLLDTDGSETLTVTISGVPANTTLNHGTNSGAVWNLTAADLTGLTIKAPDDAAFTLTAIATATESNSDSADSAPKTIAVTITNVPPENVSAGTDQTVNEGDVVHLTGTFTDPGTIDTHTYKWTVDSQELPNNTAADFSFTPDDNGAYVVRFEVTDNNGGSEFSEVTVTVNNAAPIAVLDSNAPSGVDEGSTAARVFFSGQFDISGTDTAVGFRYSYDFNNDGIWDIGDGTYAGSVTETEQGVPSAYLDDGPRNVVIVAMIIDKDDGASVITVDIGLHNVAPTATFSAPGSVAEGGQGQISFTNVFDPSGADTTARFTYSFDFNNDGSFEITGTNPVASIPPSVLANGPGSIQVGGTITDKDHGVSQKYTLTIQINNAPPTARLQKDATSTGPELTAVEFVNQADPSSADALAGYTYAFDFNDNGDYNDAGDIAQTNLPSAAVPSIYQTQNNVIRARITDRDGGFTEYRLQKPYFITDEIIVNANLGDTLDYTVPLKGLPAPSASITPIDLPPGLTLNDLGLSFDGVTAKLHGILLKAGQLTFRIDATSPGGTQSISLILNVLHSASNPGTPHFVSPPAAAPNPSFSGSEVRFSALATDDDNDIISYAWNFADGSPVTFLNRGSNTIHIYAAPGKFDVTLTISDGEHSVVQHLQVTVLVPGTNTFEVTKGAVAFDFKTPAKSAMQYGGTIPLPNGFTVTGKSVSVSATGSTYVQHFTLDTKGAGLNGLSKFTLAAPKKPSPTGSNAKFTLVVKMSGAPTLFDQLAPLGFVNTTTPKAGIPVTVPLVITVGANGPVYNQVHMLYKAVSGKSGKGAKTKK